jgi:protein gp37
MSAQTKIQWCQRPGTVARTWNPCRGCSIISEGCSNCYAMYGAHRMESNPRLKGAYSGLTRKTEHGPVWTGGIRLVHEALEQPYHWTEPSTVFVNSMSDLFHEGVPFHFINSVYRTMQEARQHTYIVLTKRPERMLEFISKHAPVPAMTGMTWGVDYTPKNIWHGVSVEDQKALDRIKVLHKVPAAVRFVSFEPLLEDLGNLPLPPKGATYQCSCGEYTTASYESIKAAPWRHKSRCGRYQDWCGSFMGDDRKPVIDWAIVGGESGPRARPCNVDWIRSVMRQCQGASVPVFVKQLGACAMFDPAIPGNPGLAPPTRLGSIPDGWEGRSLWRLALDDRKGGDPDEWPEDLRVREWPK